MGQDTYERARLYAGRPQRSSASLVRPRGTKEPLSSTKGPDIMDLVLRWPSFALKD